MDVLDARKDEAINRTFRDVKKHFEEVFQEIVPDGHATLKMLRDDTTQDATDVVVGGQAASESDSDTDDEQGKTEKNAAPTVDSYSGIAIEVSFSGTAKTTTRQLLSG